MKNNTDNKSCFYVNISIYNFAFYLNGKKIILDLIPKKSIIRKIYLIVEEVYQIKSIDKINLIYEIYFASLLHTIFKEHNRNIEDDFSSIMKDPEIKAIIFQELNKIKEELKNIIGKNNIIFLCYSNFETNLAIAWSEYLGLNSEIHYHHNESRNLRNANDKVILCKNNISVKKEVKVFESYIKELYHISSIEKNVNFIVSNDNIFIKNIQYLLNKEIINLTTFTNREQEIEKYISIIHLLIFTEDFNNWRTTMTEAIQIIKCENKNNVLLELNKTKGFYGLQKEASVQFIIDVINIKNDLDNLNEIDLFNNIIKIISWFPDSKNYIQLLKQVEDDFITKYNLLNENYFKESLRELYSLYYEEKSKKLIHNIDNEKIYLMDSNGFSKINDEKYIIEGFNETNYPHLHAKSNILHKAFQVFNIQDNYDKYFTDLIINIPDKIEITSYINDQNDDIISQHRLLLASNKFNLQYITEQLKDREESQEEKFNVDTNISLPKKIYVSDIRKMINNPAEFFIPKVLSLRRNVPINNKDLDYGNAKHKMCYEILKGIKNDDQGNIPETAFKKIIKQYDLDDLDKIKLERAINKVYEFLLSKTKEGFEIYGEEEQSAILNFNNHNIELSSIIDLICYKDNKYEIYDYKTSAKSFSIEEKGISPQLFIESLILKLQGKQVSNIAYISFANKENELKIKSYSEKGQNIDSAIIETEKKLQNILQELYIEKRYNLFSEYFNYESKDLDTFLIYRPSNIIK